MTRYRHLREVSLLCFLAISLCAFGQTEADPWLIVPEGGKGPLTQHTTHEDLVRAFGAGNIAEQDGIEGMSGDMVYVTVLFPDDPERKIEIQWRSPEKTVPAFVTVSGDKSRWKATRNISLGISLKQLEQLNGKAFRLTGFEWDYSGTILSWENGSLAAGLDGGHGRVLIRLGSPPRKDISEKELDEVAGDKPFSSHHPVMQKINPTAYEITWEFPSWEQK